MMVQNSLKNSIVLKHETIHKVFEYAQDKMIVHVAPTDLIFIENWTVIKILKD